MFTHLVRKQVEHHQDHIKMGEENTKIKALYLQEFDIDKYLHQYYSSIDAEEGFFLKQLRNIEQNLKGFLKEQNVLNM